MTNTTIYGVDDGSYQAAGKIDGLIGLVDAFYDIMDQQPSFKTIRDMHPSDLTESRLKLAYFLSGWLGGPKLYKQHYGSIHIPSAHRQLAVGAAERDAWLQCMQHAIALQPYADDFKDYLLTQLAVPAERIRNACHVSDRV